VLESGRSDGQGWALGPWEARVLRRTGGLWRAP